MLVSAFQGLSQPQRIPNYTFKTLQCRVFVFPIHYPFLLS